MNEFDKERIDFAKFHKTAEKQILPIFRKALQQSIQKVKTFVDTYGTENVPVSSLIERSIWNEAYLSAYRLIAMKAARNEYYRQRRLENETKASAIEFLIDVWTSTFRDYALNYVYFIQRELNDTTIEIISRALGKTNSLGLDRDGSIRLFQTELNGAMKLRSLTISRTEATTISNLGKEVGARSWIDEQGGGGYKVWLGRNDSRERQSHLEENNTIIPIDDEYNLNGQLAERPGDIRLSGSERIGCRCTQSLMSNNRYQAYLKRNRIVNGKLIGAS